MNPDDLVVYTKITDYITTYNEDPPIVMPEGILFPKTKGKTKTALKGPQEKKYSANELWGYLRNRYFADLTAQIDYVAVIEGIMEYANKGIRAEHQITWIVAARQAQVLVDKEILTYHTDTKNIYFRVSHHVRNKHAEKMEAKAVEKKPRIFPF